MKTCSLRTSFLRRFLPGCSAGIRGFTGLYQTVKFRFGSFFPLVLGAGFLLTVFAYGLVIFLVERRQREPRITEVDDMDWRDALKLGVAQVFSLIPGTSRSGATIIGGLLTGLSRKAATEFSFFLAIPTMFLATGFDLFMSRDHLSPSDLPFFAVGFVTAFFSALLAIKGLLRYVARHDFRAFAWYRIVFGLIALVYFYPL